MINQHKLAVQVSKQEGKKVEVNIAQIKEIIKITLSLLSKNKASDILKLLNK